MNIILIFNEILNDFNKIFNNNLNPFTFESKIREFGDLFTIKLYEEFLNYFDKQFKKIKKEKRLLKKFTKIIVNNYSSLFVWYNIIR